MRGKKVRGLGYLIFFVVLFISIVPFKEVSALKDPAPGTGPKYIEDAIKAGEELIGKSPYQYGGGRTSVTYGKYMDCSSFMHYMFNKGSGILLVNDNHEHAGGVTTGTLLSGLDIRKNVNIKDVERGEIIFFRHPGGGGHVGVYLGDGIMINDATSKGVSYARVDNSYWLPRFTGEVARIEEGGKGLTLADGGAFDGSYAGNRGNTTEIEDTDEVGNNRAKGLEKYQTRNTLIDSTGVKNKQDYIGADKRNAFFEISSGAYHLLIKTGVLISYGLLLYTSTSVAAYFVLTKKGGTFKQGEKIANFLTVEAVSTRENTKEVFKRWILSLCILTLFLTGSYVDFMAIVLRIIERLWIF